jgi:hypothetical protein
METSGTELHPLRHQRFRSSLVMHHPLAADARARHESGRRRDVCVEEGVWDAAAAMAAMGALPGDTVVCDAVLDQGVLPGAGNIIKVGCAVSQYVSA